MSSEPNPALESPQLDAGQSPVPRKRRRRAPAAGATEDCFTCRKRQTKCDRRRPYCTPCIELGKECSGYRTTLTWGVGVASRGKLRGLSLPVPKSPSNPSATIREPKRRSASAGGSAPRSASRPSPVAEGPRVPDVPYLPSSHLRDIPEATHRSPHNSCTSPISIPSPSASQLGWHVPAFREHVDYNNRMACGPSRPLLHPSPLQRLQTSLAPFYDDAALSASTGSLSTFSDSDYPSPYEFPQTPDEYPFTEPRVTQYADPFNSYWGSASSTESLDFQGAPRSYPMPTDEMSSSMRSEHSNRNELDDYEIVEPISFNPAGFSEVFYNGEISVSSGSLPEPAYPYNFSTEQSYEVVDPSLASNDSIPQNLYPAQVRQISHRMQYLFDYYDKAICPVLVAFDGPSNPYRMHILHLAMGSESLQNAIAALSTNNIRMRSGQRTQQIQSPNIPQLASPALTNEEFQAVHGEPGPEEQSYKLTSIQLLNSQLADPVKAKDDSVLATVLILCLFHVCDSGFTKFKTQLAGVQKLLSMRDRRVQSGFLGWVEMFFTWFDVMTSTVNDREMQLSGDSLDMRDLSANLGALEHLAGCEGRLFKLIARLGRLNLLSQNRPVREQNDRTPRPSPPRPSPLPKNGNDFFSINYSRLDGNGWGTPITESPPAIELTSNVDLRHEFWSEWRDIRDRLQEWEMDSPPPAPLSCSAAPPALSPSQCDLLHISESFRFSALLYIERLAHPSLPPSALNFQSLVAQALYHITQIGVTSCVNKFLLWPLFITGTECVDEGHRSIVRQRCVEIQRESGFFNNLSGLEVLERTWREDDVGGPALYDYGTRRNRQAFRWRKAMDRTDGEYIVI